MVEIRTLEEAIAVLDAWRAHADWQADIIGNLRLELSMAEARIVLLKAQLLCARDLQPA